MTHLRRWLLATAIASLVEIALAAHTGPAALGWYLGGFLAGFALAGVLSFFVFAGDSPSADAHGSNRRSS